MEPSRQPRAGRARIRSSLALVGSAFLASMFSVCLHAERIEPPLELLYAPGHVLVAGKVIDVAANRMVLQRGDVLSDNAMPPEKIEVRVPSAVLAEVKRGDHYIVGYSLARADPRHPTQTVIDPQGASVTTSIGLDPALFKDTPATRELLNADRKPHQRESRRFFDLLMKALASGDRQLQNLAAGEIALDVEIGERLREEPPAIMQKVAANPRVAPVVRASLLQSAAEHASDWGAWWKQIALDVVANTPVDGYSPATEDPTGLILTALELLDAHAVTLPPSALSRWMRSASPPLAERAGLMLRKISAALERSAINDALADAHLPPATRRFLNDHVRRRDLMDARLKKREPKGN